MITSPSPVDRLNWLRAHTPELAVLIEEHAALLISPNAADYARVCMIQYANLVRNITR